MITPHREGRRPGARRLVAGLLGLGLALVGIAMVAAWALTPRFTPAGELPPTSPAHTTRSAEARSSVPAATNPEGVSSASAGKPGDLGGALVDASFTPARLILPALGVDAAVVPVDVERGGALAIPDDPAVIGWWANGAAPGSPVGTVLMAGHVDSAEQGPGALFRLSTAPIGARLTVRGSGGEVTYVVRARSRYLKENPPWRSLLAQGEMPRLVLVTCGGDFDYRTRNYTDNVVVVATPL